MRIEAYFGGNEPIALRFAEFVRRAAIEEYPEGFDYSSLLEEYIENDSDYAAYYNAWDYLNNRYGGTQAGPRMNEIIKHIMHYE